MAKFFHIVQVHPVENGEPNLHKVIKEQEFETKQMADLYIESYDEGAHEGISRKAVYVGCVNHETGELILPSKQ
jgi:hypothetical protein